jgi:exosortase/archaeosortase family protein
MKLPFSISRRNRIILFVIGVLVFVWAILRFFILHYDPIKPFITASFEPYFLLIERLSNFILSFTDAGVFIKNHTVFCDSAELYSFDISVLILKFTVPLLILFWVINTPVNKKILYTGILILTHFLIVSIDITILAHLVVKDYDSEVIPTISHIPGQLVMTTIFTVWIFDNRASLLNTLAKLKVNTKLIESKILELIIVLYVYIIVNNFIYGFLDLHIWRNLMITSVHKILSILGYNSVIDGYYITGDYGTVVVDRGCVGYNTILKFGVLVFLTGVSNIKRWSYLISGAIFLAFLSSVRLMMIFIWYENYGLERAANIHDLSKHLIFVIIFILWIIWFEFFTDIRPKQGKRKGKIYPVFI